MAEELEHHDEDLDYSDDEIENSGIFRWLQAAVVLFAIGGFVGLAWYAYKSGEGSDDKDVELVKVEKGPVKEAPSNPGGMQIPNQDKTVYSLINNNRSDKQVVERIVPSAEEPEHAGDETATWTKSKAGAADAQNTIAASAPKIKEVAANDTAKKAGQFNPAKAKAARTQGTPSVMLTQAADPIPQDSTPKSETATTAAFQPTTAPSAPASVAEKPVAATATPKPVSPAEQHADIAPQPEHATTTITTTATSATTPSAMPKIRIQLGALKSQAEAENTWNKIEKQFSDTLGSKQHYIVRVTVNGNVFYRLQAAPFDSTQEANATCMTLVSGGQGCFLAKGR